MVIAFVVCHNAIVSANLSFIQHIAKEFVENLSKPQPNAQNHFVFDCIQLAEMGTAEC